MWKWNSLTPKSVLLERQMRTEILNSRFAILTMDENREKFLLFPFAEGKISSCGTHRHMNLQPPEEFDTSYWSCGDCDEKSAIFIMWDPNESAIDTPEFNFSIVVNLGCDDIQAITLLRNYALGGDWHVQSHELFQNFLIRLLEDLEE